MNPGDLVIRTGDWEILSVSGRLLDYPGELACMNWSLLDSHKNMYFLFQQGDFAGTVLADECTWVLGNNNYFINK